VTQILDLEPDVITVRYGFNDHDPSWNPALRATEPSSAVWRFLLYRFDDWKLARLGLTVEQRLSLLHPAPRTVRWTSPEEFEANLHRFNEVSRLRDSHLLFVDYPLRPLDRGVSPREIEVLRAVTGVESVEELSDLQDAYQAILRRTAQQEGVPLLETAEPLTHSAASFCTSDMVHPSRDGAQLIAQLLFEKLAALGWLR
jgi:lysophospholipase L1-like esterase